MESIIKKLGKASVTVEKDYHNSEKEYNKLTIVEEKDTFKTYLSRKPVPIGTELTNREYWIPFSGVLESITFDYLKFKKDYASGKAIEDNAIITRHILDRNIERIKIALKAISEEEIDDDAVIERTIKDRNVTSNKIAQENILTEHFAKKSVVTAILADYVITAIKLADNSVTTRSIVNENITDIKLANNAVTTRSIAQESIIEEKFANNSVSTRSLIDKSVTKEKLAENSVTESKIADNNITNRKIANNTIDITKFDSYTRNIIESVRYIPEEFSSIKEAIFDEINKYKPIVINGDVINAADEEDITSENNLLKLKDRSSINGMGYVILRKNKSFSEQVTKENTIYEIRYDFDLNGAEITIPRNCVLKFEGGKIANGIIVGTNTAISICSNYSCMLCDFKGTFSTEIIYAEWFGIIPNGDGTVSNTPNQHNKFEKLNNYINCVPAVVLHFKSGYYGFGDGSDTNKYVNSDAKWNNYYAFHLDNTTRCKYLEIKGNGTNFVNVYPMKVGTWNDNWTPKCKNSSEWSNLSTSEKWRVSSYGGGFLLCDNKNEEITIKISDLSVNMHREIFKFGGYQEYTCNQSAVFFHSFGNLYMDNCHLKGNVCDGTLILSSLGFYPKNTIITNCIFEDNIRCGLGNDGGLNILVKGCKFINNGQIYIPNGNTYYKFENPYDAFNVEGNLSGRTIIEDVYLEDCYFENNNRGCITIPNMNVRSVTIDKCVVNNSKPVLEYIGDAIVENKKKLNYFVNVYAEKKVSITNCNLYNATFYFGAVVHNPTRESTNGKEEGTLYWNELQPSILVDNISINCSHIDELQDNSITLVDFSNSLINYKVVDGKWTKFISTIEQGGCGKVIVGTVTINIRNGYRVIFRDDKINYTAPIDINNITLNFLEPITQEPYSCYSTNNLVTINNFSIYDYNCQETTPYKISNIPSVNTFTFKKYGTIDSIIFENNIDSRGVFTDKDYFTTAQLSHIIGSHNYKKYLFGFIHPNIIESYNKKDFNVNEIISIKPFSGGELGTASTTFYRRMNFSSPWETLYGNFTHGYNKSWCTNINTLKAELETIGYSKNGSKLAAGDICYDKSNKQLILGNNSRTDFYRYDGNPYGIAESGTRSQRPTGVKIGTMYFDTSLDTPRPIYWSGTKWVDATGADV